MVPASTLPLACAMAPLAALLVRASDLRVRPTRLRLAALALAAAFAFLVESPCCDASQGISMRACREAPPGSCCEAKVRSQSPNVLSILAADAWERVSGGDEDASAAARQGQLLAEHATRLEREEARNATRCAESVEARRAQHGPSSTPARGDGDQRACARPAARSRNVVLITVESLGALYTSLYNPDARTTPFLTALFNAAPPGDAFLLERLYASEPNTLHSLFASLCGMQPPLGTSKVQYEHKRRLAQCLPALLRAEGIHSAFYTTSNVGVQRALGFAEVWSSVEDYDSLHAKPGQPTAARKRAKKRLRWPRRWWKRTTAALLDGRSNGQYNWLGDHDYFGLPKARDFIAAQGERRFFLHMLTVSSHHPYTGVCPSPTGGASGLGWLEGAPMMARKPVKKSSMHQAAMLRAYSREVRCVDEYIKQVHGILRRAGRLHDTSLVIVSDHGEGFELAHEQDRVHGGTVYDSQVRLPFVAFGPIARGMPKRVPGVWSDTAIGPTLVEAFGLRHRDCRGGAGPVVFGCSVLSSPAPRHAMVSCAFDSTCVGLVVQMDQHGGDGALGGSSQLWKFVSPNEARGEQKRLEAYLLEDSSNNTDRYEDIDRSGGLPKEERKLTLHRMHTWLRAVHDFWST